MVNKECCSFAGVSPEICMNLNSSCNPGAPSSHLSESGAKGEAGAKRKLPREGTPIATRQECFGRGAGADEGITGRQRKQHWRLEYKLGARCDIFNLHLSLRPAANRFDGKRHCFRLCAFADVCGFCCRASVPARASAQPAQGCTPKSRPPARRILQRSRPISPGTDDTSASLS